MSVYVPADLRRQIRDRFSNCCAYRIVSVDPVTMEIVPLFHPQRDVWRDHFAWSDDASEITALTASGRATVSALRMNRPQMRRVRRLWVAMGEHPPDIE